jgi:hypothetical protein
MNVDCLTASWKARARIQQASKLPADGTALALRLLEKAVGDVELNSGDDPIVIADYGSSQGKNSLVPMQVAIKSMRKRVARNRPTPSSTSTNRRTTSIRYSRSYMPTRRDMLWMIPMFFLRRSENRSTRRCCRPVPFISGGRPMPRAQPSVRTDSGPFYFDSEHRHGARRIRTPSCAGLGGIPHFAGARTAPWRAPARGAAGDC